MQHRHNDGFLYYTWVPYGFLMVSYGFLWFLMVPYGFLAAFPMGSYRFLMGFLGTIPDIPTSLRQAAPLKFEFLNSTLSWRSSQIPDVYQDIHLNMTQKSPKKRNTLAKKTQHVSKSLEIGHFGNVSVMSSLKTPRVSQVSPVCNGIGEVGTLKVAVLGDHLAQLDMLW